MVDGEKPGKDSESMDSSMKDGQQSAPLRPEDKKWLLVAAVAGAVLTLSFLHPLVLWVEYALDEELYSHTLLIPFVSAYLIWTGKRLEGWEASRSVAGGICFLLLSIGFLTASIMASWRIPDLPVCDYLNLSLTGYLCGLVSFAFFFLGSSLIRTHLFAVAFMYFMVPMPTFFTDALTVFFQYTSADASFVLLKLSGTPIFREGFVFQLPGFAMRVAEECSGIRSSLVLFISAIIAGRLFLTSKWRRLVLVFVVIPIGIVRNAVRILTIGLLTVHVDPGIIDGPLHHNGGPLFFLASLIPFFGILYVLKKTESRKEGQVSTPE